MCYVYTCLYKISFLPVVSSVASIFHVIFRDYLWQKVILHKGKLNNATPSILVGHFNVVEYLYFEFAQQTRLRFILLLTAVIPETPLMSNVVTWNDKVDT